MTDAMSDAMPDTIPAPPDPGPRPHWLQDAALALMFLTRLPVPAKGPLANPLSGPLADGAAARAMAWFPLVGALVGLAGGAALALAGALALPPLAGALLALAATAWLTGALHEDGAADVADGFGGGRDLARKLEIMRDSRVGSYGVLALVFSVGIRAAALAALPVPAGVAALVAAGALSRCGLATLARALPPARRDGLAAAQGRPATSTTLLSLALGIAAAAIALKAAALPAMLAAMAAVLAVAALARRQIGGHTGDVFGAAQQVAEAAVLLTLAALR
ncbi:adenosylcobinamide-GDP ribazoletransferase [Azospirillum picis]|uniref:Adenosylcobinamide-GDP ribazoletransferase n=1 Tax=Azospirillum picis TaxID=488438 RepID=A0ABU0MKF4_9PROT|nr:adenosylcobinamide-GDP ribazoletransferase [Azospirillum picis]MBP2300213.1 adenosylcobinamide-GDP ribazoletransferase [Azospirillum picis]MDQ0533945.1 adenosylcobinamide-GDP ribazoletransferase [Azospirillum picis]